MQISIKCLKPFTFINITETILIFHLYIHVYTLAVIHRFVLPLLGGKAITLGLVVRLTSPRFASHIRLHIVFSNTSSANVANSEELQKKV